MIDREQFLAAIAHLSLGGEEVFRRGFVAHFRISSDVAETIKRDGFDFRNATDQPAALLRRRFASMGDHRLNMFATELNRWHGFNRG